MTLDDLRTPRMVSLEETAQRFNMTVMALQERLRRGTFPVKPKMRRPKQWSSLELLEYFEDKRRRG